MSARYSADAAETFFAKLLWGNALAIRALVAKKLDLPIQGGWGFFDVASEVYLDALNAQADISLAAVRSAHAARLASEPDADGNDSGDDE